MTTLEMILYINRFVGDRLVYSFWFGPSDDIRIFDCSLNINFSLGKLKHKDFLSEFDKYITESSSTAFCVTRLNDSFLLDNGLGKTFSQWHYELQRYWKLRLTYRQENVKLIELGNRLYKN